MFTEQIGSKKLYKDFLKKNGLFAYLRSKKKDNAEKNTKRKISVLKIIKQIITDFKSLRKKLILVLIVGIIVNSLIAVFPWFMKFTFDTVLPKNSITFLLGACSILLFLGISNILLEFLNDFQKNKMNGFFILEVKKRLMHKLQHSSIDTINNLKVGGIVSRLQQDTEGMSELLTNVVVTPLNAILIFIITITSLFIVNWQVTAIMIVFIIALSAFAYLTSRFITPFHSNMREDNSSINSLLAEIFNGYQTVKCFSKERTVKHEYLKRSGLLWRKDIYTFIVWITTEGFTQGICYLMRISVWLFGGYFYIKGTLSIGGVVLFISFVEWLFNPVFMIVNSLESIQENLACVDRTFALLDKKQDNSDNKKGIRINKIKDKLEFKNLIFTYPNGTRAVDGISLEIPKGKLTALVGPSGSGKTTLTNLILRFYQVNKGNISLDGIDINDIDLQSYRKMFSLVLQDIMMFDGTVKDNIAFGKPNASWQEIEKVAKIAHCDEFISKLSKGYKTVVGERGVKLSGGQKQRIALARAILTNPQILILDEATSNLDSESEAYIQDALKEIFRDRTNIVIAHRFSTILEADNIVVIDKGKIMEQGTHSELLKINGKYAQMYNKQIENARIQENYF